MPYYYCKRGHCNQFLVWKPLTNSCMEVIDQADAVFFW